MPSLPDGWIAFQAPGPPLKSKALTGSLYQSVSPTKLCHLGQVSVGGDRVSTPHHTKGPKTYARGLITPIGLESWRNMGACEDCHRVYTGLPS